MPIGSRQANAEWQWFQADMRRAYMVNVSRGQRKGQAMMNALGTIAPELYHIVAGTDADCFNDDSRIPEFLRVVWGV